MRRIWWELTSRRSFVSIPVHFTLIDLAAPSARTVEAEGEAVGSLDREDRSPLAAQASTGQRGDGARTEPTPRPLRDASWPDSGGGSATDGRVTGAERFVVIPVFNRIDETLICLAALRRQRYPAVGVIVVDGGSTDDTVSQLEQMADVTVITDIGEQWWTGATWYGIEYAMTHGADDDFVMLLNNDTTFGPEMLEVLVRARQGNHTARSHRSRSRADGSVINGGTWIDWTSYRIAQATSHPAPTPSSWPVDALEGRGTLVPMWAIRAAGNVDRVRLPHYGADYEFSLRLSLSRLPTDDDGSHIDRDPRRPLRDPRVLDSGILEASLVGAHEPGVGRQHPNALHAHRLCGASQGQVEAQGPGGRSVGRAAPSMGSVAESARRACDSSSHPPTERERAR